MATFFPAEPLTLATSGREEVTNNLPSAPPVGVDNIYLTEGDVARLTSFAAGTLRNMRSVGRGPAFVRVGTAIRYLRSDVIHWMESGRARDAEPSLRDTADDRPGSTDLSTRHENLNKVRW